MEAVTGGNVSFIPSARDLLLVVPRLARRAGSFALYHMPDAMDNIAAKILNGGSVIADATAQHTTTNSTITNTSALLARSTTATLEAALREAWKDPTGNEASGSLFMSVIHGVGKLKNLGGIFSYLSSKWALTTFTAAIILNRTQFYASSREHLNLRFHVRLALYILPIVTFVLQAIAILQALKCQTSPDFPLMRYGDPLKQVAIDFAADGGFLYRLSSTLLFWQDDAGSCAARRMSSAGLEEHALRGSMSLLYRFFLTLCASQLFETLCCALQGKQPMPETGMTIFEHSLAFAECEAMISNTLGYGFFGGPKVETSETGKSVTSAITRAEMLPRLNVPPEVLLVCLISCFSHISSAILAVTGLRHRVRLINTAIWACCYMSAFLWSFGKVISSPVQQVTDVGVLRFPTVCIMGFIPHLLILVGIAICAVIYGLAICITAISVPAEVAQGMSMRQRVYWAYNNLQANVQFSQASSIRISMSEDFYTTLLKVGFTILTAASEAVYLNEGSRIQVAQMTWLEQKRINELADSMASRRKPTVPAELLGDGIAKGVGFTDQQNAAVSYQSPYARERKSKPKRKTGHKANTGESDSGLGISQRRSRMQLTVDFAAGILFLLLSLQAQMTLNMLRRLGIGYRPSWLLTAAGVPQNHSAPDVHQRPARPDSLDFYMIGPDGVPTLPEDLNVDVEVEMRRRLQHAGTYSGEDNLGDSVYGWWRRGGWFGDLDTSGEFQTREAEDDDDTTSMISMSTNASTNDEMSESGQRTPTQHNPFGDRSRDSTPAPDASLDVGSLARLLNPQTSTDREEARLLSYSLQSQRPMTRSQYRRTVDRGRAQILSGLRAGTQTSPQQQSLSEADEERDMEQFILSRRSTAKVRAQHAGTWESGAEGMGESGPQCVVCQCSPRTILVWPCGCLSMCDECRVGLAARNYSKCICCRTDIAAYSRLYVP